MILVDTCVWIDHFRGRPPAGLLVSLLHQGQVLCHPWVVLELALGTLGARKTAILSDLQLLRSLPVSAPEELGSFIEEARLSGSGLSLADVELLYAAISHRCLLWTFDVRLAKAAGKFAGVLYSQ